MFNLCMTLVVNIQARAIEEVVIFRWIVNQCLSTHTIVHQETPPYTGRHPSNTFVPLGTNLVTGSVVVGTYNDVGSRVVGICQSMFVHPHDGASGDATLHGKAHQQCLRPT